MNKGISKISILFTFILILSSCNKTPIAKTNEGMGENVVETKNVAADLEQEEEVINQPVTIYGKWKLNMQKTFPKDVKNDQKLAGTAYYLHFDESQKTSTNILAGVSTVYDIQVDGNKITNLKDGKVIGVATVKKVSSSELSISTINDETGDLETYIFDRVE